MKTKSTLAILFISLFALASALGQDAGSLGDIKHSLLPPSAFREINGNQWVLMDGGVDLEGQGISWNETDLYSVSGIEIFPDARGMFLRGVNSDRETGGDPDMTRSAGSQQLDSLKKHSHFKYWLAVKGNEGGNSVKGFYLQNHEAAGQELISEQNKEDYFFYTGSSETRPKNIATYIYIKVNQ